GFKNVVINGDYGVQQRGAGGSLSISVPASTTAYTFDRWCLSTGANQASTVTATATSGIAQQARYAAIIQRTNGQTGTATMVWQAPLTTDQLAPLLGKIVTLQFKIAVGATFLTNNSGGVTCALYMGTGAEGKRAGGFAGETTTCSTTTTSLT